VCTAYANVTDMAVWTCRWKEEGREQRGGERGVSVCISGALQEMKNENETWGGGLSVSSTCQRRQLPFLTRN